MDSKIVTQGKPVNNETRSRAMELISHFGLSDPLEAADIGNEAARIMSRQALAQQLSSGLRLPSADLQRKALSLLDDLSELDETISQIQGWNWGAVRRMSRMAVTYHLAGNTEHALELLSNAKDIIDQRADDPKTRAWLLGEELSTAYLRLGDRKKAAECLRESYDEYCLRWEDTSALKPTFRDPNSKSLMGKALKELETHGKDGAPLPASFVAYLADRGNDLAQQQPSRWTLASLRKIRDWDSRSWAYRTLAEANVRAGDFVTAEKTLSEAERELDDNQELSIPRAARYCELGILHASVGSLEQAGEAWDKALRCALKAKLTPNCPQEFKRSWIRDLPRAQLFAGSLDDAERTLKTIRANQIDRSMESERICRESLESVHAIVERELIKEAGSTVQ